MDVVHDVAVLALRNSSSTETMGPTTTAVTLQGMLPCGHISVADGALPFARWQLHHLTTTVSYTNTVHVMT